MLPQTVRRDTASNAERKLFRIIRDELPDEWTVLHSLGLAGHERKPWAEIDFVLIGPPGIYSLEVKGGRIRRESGRWLFTNRAGNTTEKDEGPFEQVGGASAALANYLFARMPQLRSSIVGWAVATPDQSSSRLTGPDVDRNVLYDETDLARPFSTFMDRVVGRWRERLKRDRTLSRAETSAIVDKLRGDFDLRPSLRAQVSYVVDELVALTKEQSQALEGLVDNPRAIIRGGAGTGKTLLALEEARRWTSGGRRVLLTCFSRNLAAYLRAAAQDEPLLTVEHLHGFMARIVAENGLTHRLPDVDATDLFEVFYPELALEALLGEASEAYDVAIVDEGQDLLREAYLDILDTSLRGGLRTGSWRVFLDPRQNVFDAIQAQQLSRLSSSAPAEYRLTINCRNTIPIAVTTALLAGQDLVETLRVEGPEVETFWYADDAEQSSMVARHVQRLLSGGVRAEDIAILSPRGLTRSGALGQLKSRRFMLVELTGHPDALAASGVKFSTIRGFKGLEADAVLLVDNDVLGSSDGGTGFYVGASRARAMLAVFLRSDQRENYEALARALGERESQT